MTEYARLLPRLVQMSVHGRIEHIADKRRLAATADTGHHSKHSERELDIDILQIVLHGALHAYIICPRTFGPKRHLAAAGYVLQSH